MTLNEEGHIVTEAGMTTEPERGEIPAYYIGNPRCRISFSSLVLPDDRVVLHSYLLDPDTDTDETFLYEVVYRHEAMDAASSMVQDAGEFLDSGGNWFDGNQTPNAWLSRLAHEIQGSLH